MLRRITLSAVLGASILFAACAEEKKTEETPAAAPAAKPEEAAVVSYDLTKDEILSHADWTSNNITFKGLKWGDKAKTIDAALGKSLAVDSVGDHYRTIYPKSTYAMYTAKMTGELQKIEVYSPYADEITDPKLKKLLSTGDLNYMHEILGNEEGIDINANTTAEEHLYDAKGFRFAKYDLKGVKMNSLIFTKLKPKK